VAEPSGKQERGPFTQALFDVATLHREAQFSSYAGRTSTLAQRVSGSKSDSIGLGFGADLPASVEMERSLRRWVDYWTQKVKAESEGRPRDAQKARTRAILAEVGLDPVAVAFVYGVTDDAVKKARGRAGRDSHTGQRVRALEQERIDGKPSRQRPLTAPPRAVIDELEMKAGEDGVKAEKVSECSLSDGVYF